MKKVNLKKTVISAGSLCLILAASASYAKAEGHGAPAPGAPFNGALNGPTFNGATLNGAVRQVQGAAGQVNQQLQGGRVQCQTGAAPMTLAEVMAERNARMRQAHQRQNEIDAREAEEARRAWEEQLAIDTEVQAFRARILEAKPSQLAALKREAEQTSFAHELTSTFDLVEHFPEFESKQAFESVDEINAYLDSLMHLDKQFEFKKPAQQQAFERFKERASERVQSILQSMIQKVESMGMLQAHPKALAKFAGKITRMAAKLGAPLGPEFQSKINAMAVKLVLKHLEMVGSHAKTPEEFSQSVRRAIGQIQSLKLGDLTTEAQQREYAAMLSGSILDSAHGVKLDFGTAQAQRTHQRQEMIDGLNDLGRLFKVELGLTQQHVEVVMDTSRDEQIALEKARKHAEKRQRRDREEAERIARQLQLEEDEALARRLANGGN